MKTLFTFILVTLTTVSFSQSNKFNYTKEGLNPKYVVVEIDSFDQSELYEKSINWIKKTFKNTDEVIQTVIENEKVRFEGFTDNAICFGKSCKGLTYLIEISFRNGRYKFEPKNLSYYVAGHGRVEVSFNKGPYWNKKGKLRKVYQKIPKQIEALFNGLNDNLKQYLFGKIKEDDL